MAVTGGIEREAQAAPARCWPKLQRDTVVGAASIVCFIVGWELASFVAPAYAVPGWGRILVALADIPAFDVSVTVLRVIGSMVMSFVLGLAAAILLFNGRSLRPSFFLMYVLLWQCRPYAG